MPTRDTMSSSDLTKHKLRIRRCRGSACYTELALKTGISTADGLERLLYPNRGVGEDGTSIRTGICRHWQQGKVPSDDSLGRAVQHSGHGADLKYWRDLPLWSLLEEPFVSGGRELHVMLTKLGDGVRKILFVLSSPDTNGEFSSIDLSDSEVESLRKLRTLEAFTALLGLARLAYITGNDQKHAVCVASAFAIMGDIIHTHPQIASRAEDLFAAVWTSFAACSYLAGIRVWYEWEMIKDHLDALHKDPDAVSRVVIKKLKHEESNSSIAKIANYVFSVAK
jgi:hypothetical protein